MACGGWTGALVSGALGSDSQLSLGSSVTLSESVMSRICKTDAGTCWMELLARNEALLVKCVRAWLLGGANRERSNYLCCQGE